MEKIETSHSLRFYRQGCHVSRSRLDKEDCCLDIRKERGQKEEFLYK